MVSENPVYFFLYKITGLKLVIRFPTRVIYLACVSLIFNGRFLGKPTRHSALGYLFPEVSVNLFFNYKNAA